MVEFAMCENCFFESDGLDDNDESERETGSGAC